MGKININYLNGGIGGVVSSTDYISGLIFDSTVLPSGFDSENRVKAVYSVKDAEDLGIVDTHVGETKATGGSIQIVSGGTSGDYIQAYITPTNGPKTLIGSYTVTSNDTEDSIATGLGGAINLGGIWSATVATDIVTLIAPDGEGESINGAGVITVEHKTGTNFNTIITDFSGGIGSQIDIMHYLVDSFFKANSTTKLWLGVYDFTSSYDADKIAEIQTAAGGEIRQLGVWLTKGLDGIQSIVTESNTVAIDQATKHKPLSVIIGTQEGTATLDTLVNLRTLTCPRVSVTIGNAYGTEALGYNLKGQTGVYPTDLGELLGHISRSRVSNSIGWVQANVTQNTEVMLVTGEEWKAIENTTTKIDELNAKGYIFEGKYFGYNGSYFQNDATADALTSDYNSIKRQRTIDKSARLAYTTLVPYLSSPVLIDATTGTLSQDTIGDFTGVLNQAMTTMVTAGEITGFSVYIDPTQNVLANNTLEITITIVPIGSADEITVNLGYALSLA